MLTREARTLRFFCPHRLESVSFSECRSEVAFPWQKIDNVKDREPRSTEGS